MNETPLEYFSEPGESIDDACRNSLRIANTNKLPVWFNFNGTRVEVEPGMSIIDAANQYFRKRYRPTTETMIEEQKYKAAIAAMNAYKEYAVTHAQEIANEAAALLVRFGAHPDTYPHVADFLGLRMASDAATKEVMP